MVLTAAEPMILSGLRLVKRQNRHLPPRRTFPSNNHNRLWGFYSQIFAKIPVKSCMTGLPGDGGHAEFRATGAGKDAPRGRRHASLVRLMVLRHFC